MPLTVRKFNAQVKDPQSGQMVPAGLLSSDSLQAIEAAESAAITEIQQKGAQTKADIPDDYTELSESVGELKTQMQDNIYVITPTMTNGSKINNNGTVGSESASAASDAMYVKPGWVCKIENIFVQGGRAVVAFDADDNKVETIAYNTDDITEVTYTVSDRVAYIRATARTGGSIKCTCYTKSIVDSVYNEIDEANNRIDGISGPGINLYNKNGSNIANVYPKTDGTLVYRSNTNARTVWISCKPSTTYTISKIAGLRFKVTYGTEIPSNGNNFENVTADDTATSITVTTSAIATVLAAYVWQGGTDTETLETILDSIQIEEGGTATPYKPYEIGAMDNAARDKADALKPKVERNASDIDFIFRNDTAVNLFNYESAHIFNGYPRAASGTYTSSSSTRTIWFECEPDSVYYIAKKAGMRFDVVYGSEMPENGASFEYRKGNNVGEWITIRTSQTARYIGCYIWSSTADTDSFDTILESIRVHKLEKINFTCAAPETMLGDEMIADFSAMTPTGGSTYSNGKWHLPENGGIETTVTVEAGKTYYINPTVDENSVAISDYSTNLIINPLAYTLGDASISIFANRDANWRVCLTPTAGGTVTFAIECQGKLSLDITGLSVKSVEKYPENVFYANDMSFFVHRYNAAFGGGQNKIVNSNEAPGRNVAFGRDAQRDLDTGYANTAVGVSAQAALLNGRANTALGQSAQRWMTTGMYNNAVGTVAQGNAGGNAESSGQRTTGCWNNAFGNEAQRDLTSGNNNTGMGRRAQSYLTTGCENTAYGSLAGFTQVTGHGDHGEYATKTGNYQTLIGAESIQADSTNGEHDYATALGYKTYVGTKALALGAEAEAVGEKSVAIGYGVQATNDNEVVIGDGDSSIILAGKRITFNQDGTVTWTAVTP